MTASTTPQLSIWPSDMPWRKIHEGGERREVQKQQNLTRKREREVQIALPWWPNFGLLIRLAKSSSGGLAKSELLGVRYRGLLGIT
jgi:hypothetical protein